MVVRSTRLGRVLPGSKATPARMVTEDPTDPTGGVTLTDAGGGGSSSLSGQAASAA